MTKTPTLNVELLDATMAEVEKAARRKGTRKPGFDQNVWRLEDGCRTTMCFAGWALTVSGADWSNLRSKVTGVGSRIFGVDVSKEASRRLGLTHYEAEHLFLTTGTLAEVRRAVALIKAGAFR